MIKPIGNRLVIRCVKGNEKKVGDKTLITSVNDDKKGFYRFFVENAGSTEFKKDQEIIIFDHSFLQMWPDCGDLRIINASDIYGVVEL